MEEVTLIPSTFYAHFLEEGLIQNPISYISDDLFKYEPVLTSTSQAPPDGLPNNQASSTTPHNPNPVAVGEVDAEALAQACFNNVQEPAAQFSFPVSLSTETVVSFSHSFPITSAFPQEAADNLPQQLHYTMAQQSGEGNHPDFNGLHKVEDGSKRRTFSHELQPPMKRANRQRRRTPYDQDCATLGLRPLQASPSTSFFRIEVDSLQKEKECLEQQLESEQQRYQDHLTSLQTFYENFFKEKTKIYIDHFNQLELANSATSTALKETVQSLKEARELYSSNQGSDQKEQNVLKQRIFDLEQHLIDVGKKKVHLKEKIQTLEQKLSCEVDEKTDLRADLDKTAQTLEDKVKENEVIAEELSSSTSALSQTKEENVSLQMRLKKQEADLLSSNARLKETQVRFDDIVKQLEKMQPGIEQTLEEPVSSEITTLSKSDLLLKVKSLEEDLSNAKEDLSNAEENVKLALEEKELLREQNLLLQDQVKDIKQQYVTPASSVEDLAEISKENPIYECKDDEKEVIEAKADSPMFESPSPGGEALPATETKSQNGSRRSSVSAEYPEYDQSVNYVKTRKERTPREEEGEEKRFKTPRVKEDDSWVKVERKRKEEKRRSISPEKSKRSSSSSDRGTSISRERRRTFEKTMSVPEAAAHFQDVRGKVLAIHGLIDNKMGSFKQCLSDPKVSEEEKFRRIDNVIQTLFRCSSFQELKTFTKTGKVSSRSSRLAKGLIPDFRTGSEELEFMKSWPAGKQKKENSFVNFNHVIVAFRPYCQLLFETFLTLLAHGKEHSNVTELLFARDYDKHPEDPTKKIYRSEIQKRFDLILVVSVAKVYFSLQFPKEVKGRRVDALRVRARTFTKEWAEELSASEGGVNHLDKNSLLALYVETRNCYHAVNEFYAKLHDLKKDEVEEEEW